MRSHAISLLMVTAILPLSGCGSLMRPEEQAAVQPVQVQKVAPVKKAAVAAPVQPKVVVKKPIVAATPSSDRGDRSDRGEGGGGWK